MHRTFLIPIVMLFLSVSVMADAASDEKAVWNLEEAYWKYVKNNDTKGYATLWDERFIGWPGFSPTPVGKAKISDWIPPLHKNPSERYDYELTKEAIRSFGDVVVVHYLVHDFYRSATSGEVVRQLDQYRITHTWQRHGDTWQIITGMSSTQPNKK
jgi:ketosteroid isomerase-like protein